MVVEKDCLYIGYDKINEETCELISSNGSTLRSYSSIFVGMKSYLKDRFKLRSIENIPLDKPYIYPLTLFECNESMHRTDEKVVIPVRVLDDIHKKRCVVLIDFASEGLEDSLLGGEIEEFMLKLCNEYNIEHTSMVYLDGNHAKNRNTSFKYFSYNTWDKCNTGLGDEETDSIITSIESKTHRDFKISCFNRTGKSFRAYLGYSLADMVKNDDVIFTMSDLVKGLDHRKFGYTLNDSRYKEFVESLPWEYDVKNTPLHNILEINKPVHSNTYVHITTESQFDKSVFFTEKTFKPIIMVQPFIMVASPGTLSGLRSFGYETFPEMFDESYDEIENPQNRLDHIVNEIRKIYSYSKQELSNKLYEVLPKLIHNAKLHKTISADAENLYTLLKRGIYNE